MTPPDANAQTDQRSNPLRLLHTCTHWCFSAERTWKAQNHLCLSVCHLLSIPTLQAAIERHLRQRRKTHCVQAPLRALFCFTEARPTSAPFTLKEVVITPLLLALTSYHGGLWSWGRCKQEDKRWVGEGGVAWDLDVDVFVKRHQFK